MRDLSFEQLAGSTLKVCAFLLIPCGVLLSLNYAPNVAWGLLIGIGTGMWNTYFMARRSKLIDPGDDYFKLKLQKSLLTGVLIRLLTILAMFCLAYRISPVTAIAASAGMVAVWGIFTVIAAGAMAKQAKKDLQVYKQN